MQTPASYPLQPYYPVDYNDHVAQPAIGLDLDLGVPFNESTNYAQSVDPTQPRVCSVCRAELPPQDTSSKKRILDEEPGACKDCVEAGRMQAMQPDSDRVYLEKEMPVIRLADFLRELDANWGAGKWNQILTALVRVSTAELLFPEPKDVAREMARLISEALNWRFINATKSRRGEDSEVAYTFSCAQSGSVKRSRVSSSKQVRTREDGFECSGKLVIAFHVTSWMHWADVSLKHDDAHTPYTWNKLPDDVKTFLLNNKWRRNDQIWGDIVATCGRAPNFSMRSVIEFLRTVRQVDESQFEHPQPIHPLPVPQLSYPQFDHAQYHLHPVVKEEPPSSGHIGSDPGAEADNELSYEAQDKSNPSHQVIATPALSR